ncbi:MAG: ABC transporter ATP-binding protein [Paraclostridium sp.]
MIKGEQIEFSYNKNKSFIEKLDINIEKGKITTILGPNGSGKSTVLSILSCFNKPINGNVLVENQNLNKMKYKEIAKLISSVHQHNEAPEDITVETLVSYGRTPYTLLDRNEDEKLIEYAINATNLNELRDKSVMSLSGGERQRAFIAMALAQNTKVLFLDEPTTYLDIYHQIEILELIKTLNKKHNMTIIMVLHDINQAIKYSHNIVVMKKGKIIESGKSKDIINKNLIKKVYNVEGFISNTDEGELYFIPIKVC